MKNSMERILFSFFEFYQKILEIVFYNHYLILNLFFLNKNCDIDANTKYLSLLVGDWRNKKSTVFIFCDFHL